MGFCLKSQRIQNGPTGPPGPLLNLASGASVPLISGIVVDTVTLQPGVLVPANGRVLWMPVTLPLLQDDQTQAWSLLTIDGGDLGLRPIAAPAFVNEICLIDGFDATLQQLGLSGGVQTMTPVASAVNPVASVLLYDPDSLAVTALSIFAGTRTLARL